MQNFLRKNKKLSLLGGQQSWKNGILFAWVRNPLRKQKWKQNEEDYHDE